MSDRDRPTVPNVLNFVATKPADSNGNAKALTATGAVIILWAVTLTVIAVEYRTAETLVSTVLSLACTATVALAMWGCTVALNRRADERRRLSSDEFAVLRVQLNTVIEGLGQNAAGLEQISAKISAKLAADEWQEVADAIKSSEAADRAPRNGASITRLDHRGRRDSNRDA